MSLSDYRSIIHSASFTFLVGPEHTKLTIQSGLAKHVSKPLDELMNNGETRESRHRIAALENEDVETFVGFCEYAYTGDYTAPSPGRRANGADQDNCNASEKGLFRTESVFTSIPPPVTYSPAPAEDDYGPPGVPTPVSEAETVLAAEEPAGEGTTLDEGRKGKKGGKKGKKGKKQQAGEEHAVEEPAQINLTPPTTPPPDKGHGFDAVPAITVPQSPAFSFQQAETGTSTPFQPTQPKRVNLWDEFTSLKYDYYPSSAGDNISFPFSPNRRQADKPSASEPQPEPYVLFHAKLYIFAANYMIPSLGRLCLKKLHQDLIIFGTRSAAANDNPAAAEDIKTANMRAILQLLHFTYTNTSRYDPFFDMMPHHDGVIPPPKEDELRKLVSHYAACKVRDLAAITSGANYFYPPPMSVHDGIGGEGGYHPHMDATDLGFRELLDGTRELASDLVYRMM